MSRKQLNLSLYVVLDPSFAKGRPIDEVCEAALLGGADVIQLRHKDAPALTLYEEDLRLRELCRRYGKLFIMNDRVDLALAMDADGVHLGQDDLPPAVARRLLGPDHIIGVSASTSEEARRAEQDGADYLGVGAIYEARGSKTDAGAPIGPRAIAAIKAGVSIPIVGIGGINAANAAEVVRAGADGVAVLSAVVSAPDVAQAARELRSVVEHAKAQATSRRK